MEKGLEVFAYVPNVGQKKPMEDGLHVKWRNAQNADR